MRRIAIALAVLAAATAVVVVATANEHKGPPPLVVVVFDALATTMLLGSDGKIDAVRYPNFAELAETSTWYPNATMVHDSTIKSVPSVLDGRWPYMGQPPDVQGHPNNAFIFFHPRWRIDAAEEATELCPPRICPGRPPKRRVVELLHAGREGRYLEAVARIGRKPQPAFHFIHTMLPHEPLRYFPSGRTYQPQVDPEPGLDGTESYDNEFLSQQAWQRHLLQLGFTDRLLGRLIARMKSAGIWDDAVLVVTADHGMSFTPKDSPAPRFQIGRLGYRRDVTPANAADVMSVPLFVKAPGQDDGEVDDTWARTIDIFPTIADLAGVRLRWRVHGRSLLGERPRPRVIRVVRNEGGSLRVGTAALERGRAATLARQRELFGTGTDSLFRIGPHTELIGRETASLPQLERGRVRVRLRAPGTRRQMIPGSRYRPSNVLGWVEGGRPDGRALAAAVNGRIAATGWSFRDMGSTEMNVSILLPEDAFRPGTNEVQVYEVVDGASLRPLTG